MYLSVFVNVLIMLVYLSFGFILAKCKKASDSHLKTMSSILVYILSPAMIINSFVELEYDKNSFLDIVIFFFTVLILQVLFFIILYLIFKKKLDDPKYRILSIASVLGNVGFFGLPVIVSLFPDNPIVKCYSSVYAVSMNLVVFTIGVFMITKDKKFISLKSFFFNPSTIALVVALPLFILNVKLPSTIGSGLLLLSKMVTPMCMFVLGIRLSSMRILSLFNKPFVYLTGLLKLVVYPLFGLLLVYFIPGLSDTFKISVFVLSACPSGIIIESLSEIYNKEQEISSNIVLLSTLLTIVTMPIMLLLIERII